MPALSHCQRGGSEMKKSHLLVGGLAAGIAWLAAAPVSADSVGQGKVSSGSVSIERAGQRLPGPVGTNVEASDNIGTGADGSAGTTFCDKHRRSVRPNYSLASTRL